jgi:uncharacterized protein YrrD
MDAKSLSDVAIVSVEGAARLGRIKDVLFEMDPLRVAGLRTADESGESIVPFERVSSFGSDAVMVETPGVSALAVQGSLSHLPTLADMQKLKVVDESGGYVGTVRTVEFDPASGRVERIVTEAGGVLGVGSRKTTIEAQDLRSVGTDLLTVAKTTDTAPPTD